MVTVADATLSVETGSATSELTVAVLVTAPATVGVVAIVMDTVAPLGTAPSAHEIAGPLALHVPWEDVGGEASARVAGRVSASVTAVASDGPALATVIVYESEAPTGTGLGVATIVTPRSA
jgi:hypothetical protein